jgi:glutamate 5-kinase
MDFEDQRRAVLDASASTPTASLLPVGVTAARGQLRGDVVLPGSRWRAVARTRQLRQLHTQILGCTTREIEGRLGYVDEPELMHRDNLVLL